MPITNKEKTKVGIVGEIYIKYAALGNNNLEAFLQRQNCEYMLPGLMNFIMYCVDTYLTDYKLTAAVCLNTVSTRALCGI